MLTFVYMLGVVALTRLFWVFRDTARSPRAAVTGTVVQLLAASLLLGPNWSGLVLMLAVVAINAGSWHCEQRPPGHAARLAWIRLGSLAAWVVVLTLLASRAFDLDFGPVGLTLARLLQRHFDVLAGVDRRDLFRAFAYLLGAALAVGEAHVLLRVFFGALTVKPSMTEQPAPAAEDANDRKELSRGRIIGTLERLIVFFFLVNGAYGAVGFVLAAKGLARFKQLDNRDFAEYFLIGTFVSLILAGAAALLSRGLLLIGP